MTDFAVKAQQLKASPETIRDLEALLEVSKLLHATIEAHGGRVWVENNAGRPGSKFIIRLRSS